MERLTPREARTVAATLVLLSLPALAAPAVGVETRATLALVDPAQPYLAAARPLLLYLGMPLVVASSLVLVLAPGLLLALAADRARSASEWILGGFAASVVSVSAAAAAVQGLLGAPLRGAAFVATVLGTAAAAWALLEVRLARGAAIRRPSAPGGPAGILLVHGLVPLVLLVALTPKFFWEDFNSDGAHAYESARLLLSRPLPFWPAGAGGVSAYPGVHTVLFAFPCSWFIRLFGEVEAAARLPMLLHLVVLHAGVLAIVRDEPERRMGAAAHALVWAGLASFALVMSYSATYDPYSADIALPGAQDVLLVACFLGAVVGFLRQDLPWTVLFVFLTLTASPAGILLLAAWGLGVCAGWTPRPWRRVGAFAAVVVACSVLLAVGPRALPHLGLPGPGSEHGAGSLARKYLDLSLLEFERLAWLVVPAGIYPAVSFLVRRTQDGAARALAVAAAAVYLPYYVLAFVSLHYFAPAMVLPLVAFWRGHDPGAARRPRLALALCGAGAAAALWLSLPTGTAIHTASSAVGARFDASGVPGYATSDATRFRAADLYLAAFPPAWQPGVPERLYGGSTLVWNYYGERALEGSGPGNYVLLPAETAAPAGATLLRTDGEHSLWVRDRVVWEADRTLRPAGSRGKAIYALPPEVQFGTAPTSPRGGRIDLRPLRDALRGRGS